MKKVVSLAVMFGLILSSSAVFAVEGCVKCHKSMDKVAELIKKTGVKSADELVDFLRNKSRTKALHKKNTDEEIKQAFAAVKK
jgi:hypothetical protein